MTSFLTLATLLAILAWTDGGAGPRSPQAAAFLALLGLAGLLTPSLRSPGVRTRVIRLAWLVAAGAAFWCSEGVLQAYVLAAALGFGLARSTVSRTAALAALFFAGFVAVRDYLPLWVPLSNASAEWSAAFATAIGQEARLGPTRFGMWMVAAALAIAAATAATQGRRALPGVALAALLALAVPPAVLALDRVVSARPTLLYAWPGDEEAILLLLLLLPIGILARVHSPRDRAFAPRVALAGAAIAILAGVALLATSRGFPAARPRVLLDGRGGFSLERLEWGRYGPDAPQGASLATLPDVLAAWRFPLTVSSSAISPALLAEHDVLVVMNPKANYAAAEHQAIWDFIARGGGLLVLGDHTNILGSREPLDALLWPARIRVLFDSAIPEVERWTWYGCARMQPHPLLRGVDDETDVKISVGASLALEGDAVPLILGRHAFSDAGDSTNARGAYLGNMRPDPSERRGDLVVAAEAPHGRGKIVVFGDTSPFQRGAITQSRDLVLRLLVYLGTPGHATLERPWRTAGAGLLAVGLLALLFAPPGAGGVAGIAAVAALLTFAVERTARIELPEPDRSNIAWIDVAHGNRVDLHSGRDDGISGLTDHLSRHGWLALTMKRFDPRDLTNAQAFVTVAPAFPFPERERKAIVRFVEEGGLLVVASGYEEGRGSASLLAEFGFTLGSTPLGAAHAAKTRLAIPGLLMHEAWPVASSTGDATILAEAWDIPFVMARRVGRGGVLVIGDSQFLGDAKQENVEQAITVNIEFLKKAIELARGSENSP